MKNTKICLFVLTVVLFACKKDEATTATSPTTTTTTGATTGTPTPIADITCSSVSDSVVIAKSDTTEYYDISSFTTVGNVVFTDKYNFQIYSGFDHLLITFNGTSVPNVGTYTEAASMTVDSLKDGEFFIGWNKFDTDSNLIQQWYMNGGTLTIDSTGGKLNAKLCNEWLYFAGDSTMPADTAKLSFVAQK